jgi:hypothetical protein
MLGFPSFVVLLCLTSPLYSLTTTNVGSSYTRYSQFINTLTTIVQGNCRAVHSSGGAAGGVVSEGQGYGILIGALTASALGSSSPNYRTVVQQTYEMYLGWKRMCSLSIGNQACQTGYCQGGIPCLPHWKFDDALSSPWGTGSATDGDADAITGLIVLTRLTQNAGYSWWNEVAEFSYQSCRQFFDSETITSGSYRTTKLGACWGGWDCQNPSYLAPAMYRVCRNYMRDFSSSLNHGTQGSSYVTGWNTLISTTYDILNGAQCSSTGLTPNWYVPNRNTPSLLGSTSCSGSGTPSAQFGAEASRGIWRIALDNIWFTESAFQSGQYLDRVSNHLLRKFVNGNFGSLDTGCLVTSIFSNWLNEAFIYGPTFTSLVKSTGVVTQQTALNRAGTIIGGASISSYYAGSWVAIATLTLNGDIAKSAGLVNGGTAPSPVTIPTTTAPPPAQTISPPTALPSCPKKRIYGSNTWDSQFGGSWSWGTFSLSDSYIRYIGTSNTLSVKLENFNALQLRCATNCISTSTYKAIEFVTRTSASQHNIRVRLRTSDGEVGSNVIQRATTTWTKITVMLSTLAPGGTQFNSIQFQDDANFSLNSVYFDEIYLIPINC